MTDEQHRDEKIFNWEALKNRFSKKAKANQPPPKPRNYYLIFGYLAVVLFVLLAWNSNCSLASKVDGIQSSYNQNQNTFNKAAQEQKQALKNMNDSIGKVNSQLTTITGNVATVTATANSLKTQIDGFNNQLSAYSKKTDLQTALQNYQSDLQAVKTKLSSLSNYNDSSIRSQLAILQSTVDALKSATPAPVVTPMPFTNPISYGDTRAAAVWSSLSNGDDKYPITNLIDGNWDTYWIPQTGVSYDGNFIGLQYVTAITPTQFSIRFNKFLSTTIKIQASNDNVTWVDIASGLTYFGTIRQDYGLLNSVISYKLFKVSFSSTSVNTSTSYPMEISFSSGSTSTGGTVTSSGLPDLYLDGDNDNANTFVSTWIGQTFTTSKTYVPDNIRLKIYRDSAAIDYGAIKVSIFATSGGLPVGEALAEGSIPSMSITAGSANFYAIPMSDMILQSNTTYAVVGRAPFAREGGIALRANTGSPTYNGGTFISSANNGQTWSASANRDLIFQIVAR